MGRHNACEGITGITYLMKWTCFSGMVIKGDSRVIHVSRQVVTVQLQEKHQCSISEAIYHIAADVSCTHLCQEDSWPLRRV